MNQRRIEILTKILTLQDFPTFDRIAEWYGKSTRSARYDIQAINEYLTERSFPMLRQNEAGEFHFPFDKADQDRLRSLLSELGSTGSRESLSREQRVSAILSRLLLSGGFLTIGELAEELAVSRNTVSGDLEAVGERLDSYNLKLRAAPRYGLSVEGREKNIRHGYIRLLREAMPLDRYLEIGKATAAQTARETLFPQMLYAGLARRLDFRVLENLCAGMQRRLDLHLSDFADTNVLVGLAVSVFRAACGRHCTPDDYNPGNFEGAGQYRAVLEIAPRIDERFGVSLSQEDCCFVAQCLMGADLLYGGAKESGSGRTDRRLLVSNLIARVSAETGVDFTSDRELWSSINGEAGSSLYRAGNEMELANPYLAEIKEHYPRLFQAVKNNVAPLELFSGQAINEHEIGRLTMHFIVSSESHHTLSRKVRALVMCVMGFGSANLLVSKLKRFYGLEVVGVVSQRDLAEAVKKGAADCVITTLPLGEAGLPSVSVSPFLHHKDVEKINAMIARLSGPASRAGAAGATEAVESRGEQDAGLLDVLSLDAMDMDYRAESFSDAIYRCGELLMNQGIVREAYVYSMIETMEKVGPYIVFAKGVALPHSNACEYVNRLGVSMVKTHAPVVSGHPNNDPVSLLFAFASKDNESHIRVMVELGKVISCGGAQRLISADSPAEALGIIKECLAGKAEQDRCMEDKEGFYGLQAKTD